MKDTNEISYFALGMFFVCSILLGTLFARLLTDSWLWFILFGAGLSIGGFYITLFLVAFSGDRTKVETILMPACCILVVLHALLFFWSTTPDPKRITEGSRPVDTSVKFADKESCPVLKPVAVKLDHAGGSVVSGRDSLEQGARYFWIDSSCLVSRFPHVLEASQSGIALYDSQKVECRLQKHEENAHFKRFRMFKVVPRISTNYIGEFSEPVPFLGLPWFFLRTLLWGYGFLCIDNATDDRFIVFVDGKKLTKDLPPKSHYAAEVWGGLTEIKLLNALSGEVKEWFRLDLGGCLPDQHKNPVFYNVDGRNSYRITTIDY
jgi:hypothetical protein